MEAAAENARKLLGNFRDRQAGLFHIQHLSEHPGSTFFLPCTEGVKTHAMVTPGPGEKVVEKHYPNSFRDTVLLNELRGRGISDLVICGAMSHMCIDATTRAAFDYGFNCTVIQDACATRDLSFSGDTIRAADVHGAFMAALAVPYARVLATEQYLSDP